MKKNPQKKVISLKRFKGTNIRFFFRSVGRFKQKSSFIKFLSLWTLLIFSSACQYVEDPPNTKAAMKTLVLSDTVRWLKAEKELYACGWGGQGKDKIQMMALSFFYHKPVKSIEQGRDLLISAIQRFIGEIYKETRLHKYLEKKSLSS